MSYKNFFLLEATPNIPVNGTKIRIQSHQKNKPKTNDPHILDISMPQSFFLFENTQK